MAGLSLGEYTLSMPPAASVRGCPALVNAARRADAGGFPVAPQRHGQPDGLEPAQVDELCAKASAHGIIQPAQLQLPGARSWVSGEKAACEAVVALAEQPAAGEPAR